MMPKVVDLNFKVSEEFRREFKIEAARRGTSMKGLLELLFGRLRARRKPPRKK